MQIAARARPRTGKTAGGLQRNRRGEFYWTKWVGVECKPGRAREILRLTGAGLAGVNCQPGTVALRLFGRGKLCTYLGNGQMASNGGFSVQSSAPTGPGSQSDDNSRLRFDAQARLAAIVESS